MGNNEEWRDYIFIFCVVVFENVCGAHFFAMPINLTKGSAPRRLENAQGQGLTNIYIGLGWDVGQSQIDLDASVACLNQQEKLAGSEWFVFYNNLTSPDRRSVMHSGDNRDGQGAGDDESVKIDLTAVPPNINKLLLIVSMHDAKGKNFTHVQNAFFRVVDCNTNQETHRLDLSAGQGGQTECLIFAEIVRGPGGWSISPVCYAIPSLSALLGNLQ